MTGRKPAGSLTAPWDTDQAALNAVEVLSNPSRYREDPAQAVWCTCRRPRRLVQLFNGRLASGEARSLFLVPGYFIAGRAVPALCAPAPAPGEPWRPLYGACRRCRRGVVVFYDDRAEIAAMRTRAEVCHLVLSFGVPESAQPEAGQETSYVESGTWSDGPAGSWLLWVDAPAIGAIVR